MRAQLQALLRMLRQTEELALAQPSSETIRSTASRLPRNRAMTRPVEKSSSAAGASWQGERGRLRPAPPTTDEPASSTVTS
jgi:hypothetical protein